ncbi:MAG: DUF938 domain-containing protein [Bacteriovoracaceae bacterium]|nr:DUF938 domain-containing protein [Bacteriovoracaceae bacterium]
MDKPFAPAAQRNAGPIFDCLKELIDSDDRRLLEIGSGTGQHGSYFAKEFKQLTWIFSDLEQNHQAIKAWIEDAGIDNYEGPLKYESGVDAFPARKIDIVYTANTFHIMSWKKVKTLIKAIGKELREGSRVFIYGPFNYNGQFTSESNKEFDQMLRERDPNSGIRGFEEVKKQMEDKGFRLLKDYEMPANNRLLAFLKI